MRNRTTTIPAALLAASALTPTVTADSDEYSSMASLEILELVPGGDTAFRVRSPRIGALALLLADSGPGVFDLGPGLPLLSLSPEFSTLGSGMIGPNGSFDLTATTAASGTTFSVQALVLDTAGHWFASGCRTATVEPPTLPTWEPEFPQSELSATDVDFADLDRDGFPDAVVANDGTGAFTSVLMSGTLNEGDLRLPLEALRPSSCVELADVDRDGHVDIFLGGGTDLESPAPNVLLINDGTGYFEIAQSPPRASTVPGKYVRVRPCRLDLCYHLPGGAGYAVDAEFGDVDGDGDLDLFVVNIQDLDHFLEVPDPVTLYRNQGGIQGGRVGTFLEDTVFATIPGIQPHTANADVSVGDVDDDGDLDLFVSAVGVQNQLFVNDGTGVFTEQTATALPAEVDDSFEADFGDFDGDGDLDIVVANNIASDPSAIHYYENVTVMADMPLFVDASSNIPASLGPVSSVRLATDVGDADGDGDLDLLMGIHELPRGGGQTAGQTVLLLNQGGIQGGTPGTFLVDASFAPGTFIVADAAFGDIDLDGDLDVYLANSGDLFQTDFDDEIWLNE